MFFGRISFLLGNVLLSKIKYRMGFTPWVNEGSLEFVVRVGYRLEIKFWDIYTLGWVEGGRWTLLRLVYSVGGGINVYSIRFGNLSEWYMLNFFKLLIIWMVILIRLYLLDLKFFFH